MNVTRIRCKCSAMCPCAITFCQSVHSIVMCERKKDKPIEHLSTLATHTNTRMHTDTNPLRSLQFRFFVPLVCVFTETVAQQFSWGYRLRHEHACMCECACIQCTVFNACSKHPLGETIQIVLYQCHNHLILLIGCIRALNPIMFVHHLDNGIYVYCSAQAHSRVPPMVCMCVSVCVYFCDNIFISFTCSLLFWHFVANWMDLVPMCDVCECMRNTIWQRDINLSECKLESHSLLHSLCLSVCPSAC